MRFFVSFLLSCWIIQGAFSQTVVRGVVRDSATRAPLPSANIYFEGKGIGVTSDGDGRYTIRTELPYTLLSFSYFGYKVKVKKIIPGKEQEVDVLLTEEIKDVEDVVIAKKRVKYRNKNNPAVELVKKVIDHKQENRSQAHDFLEYEKYQKIIFALSNVNEKFKNKKAFRKFQFVFDNIDTTRLEGKPILPMYIDETLSDVYYRKDPPKTKEFVKANKRVSFDGYVDNEGLNQYMRYLYSDVDIYENNVPLLSNQFLSPIADLAPAFYKFYIMDTVGIEGQKYVHMTFAPRNKTDFLFLGDMYIGLDSSYAVKRIDMFVSKDINLNWVKDLRVAQEFERNADGKYILVKDETSADFGLTDNEKKMGIFGQRSVSYKNSKTGQPRPDKFYSGLSQEIASDAQSQNEEYWLRNRHDSLSSSEKNTYVMIDSVKKIPAFKRALDITTVLLAGYKRAGSYFEIGPLNTFYSFNPVEGFRLRLGGRTTTMLSKKYMFETYLAYGFKDHRYKGYLGATYSLTPRSIFEFPVRSVRVSYQSDTKIPGQELQFIQEDNFLLSFKRGKNDKWLYNDIVNVDYLNEFPNHFSFNLGLKYWIQDPAGSLRYQRLNGEGIPAEVKNLTTAEYSVTLRYAPNEQFYQGKSYRIPLYNKYPILTLRYIGGVKGVFNSEYDYHNITVNIYKRFFLSQLGYTDVTLEGGKVLGTIPFPLLSIHRANQTYSYQLQSYNLMNFLEFVSDQYVSLNIDHWFNGFIFNKIPLIKKTKLREVLAVKVLYGSITDKNKNMRDPDVYLFPATPAGTPLTYTLEGKPYVEGSIGIANIFKLFRIDLVKRFTYLDHSNVAEFGVRGRFKFDF